MWKQLWVTLMTPWKTYPAPDVFIMYCNGSTLTPSSSEGRHMSSAQMFQTTLVWMVFDNQHFVVMWLITSLTGTMGEIMPCWPTDYSYCAKSTDEQITANINQDVSRVWRRIKHRNSAQTFLTLWDWIFQPWKVISMPVITSDMKVTVCLFVDLFVCQQDYVKIDFHETCWKDVTWDKKDILMQIRKKWRIQDTFNNFTLHRAFMGICTNFPGNNSWILTKKIWHLEARYLCVGANQPEPRVVTTDVSTYMVFCSNPGLDKPTNQGSSV